MANKEAKSNISEIINQKKQFIFEVDQTSDYVFPNEKFKYYIYIKNISGTKINHFKIQIENPEGVHFDIKEIDNSDFSIESDEVKLYDINVYCTILGKHIVHFIGFGEGTQIIHRQLTIRCTRTYDRDTLLHRISIYDFTPYEDTYKLEADNYSNEVTQITKVQKLPYRPKEGDEDYEEKIKQFSLQKTSLPENIESESFLKQYEIAKNTKEHVYQYISRENFVEDSIESYTGTNLMEIFEKINKNSEYFRGEFIKSGTNHLLNDFRQYAPNGFIYRMGLLNSEIYHNLGVIPTYSYMSDRLFRWAPSEEQLLDLTPKKTSMHWDRDIWGGTGWIVYRIVTDEYSNTEEFKQKLENNSIEKEEIIGSYEQKRVAEETVKKLEEQDELQRTYERTDLIRYRYEIHESIYDTGVFYVNIPINKIPSNFYLITNKELSKIINRAKPYGTKPIINYIIEKTFDQRMEQSLILNYYEESIFDMSDYNPIDYQIIQDKYSWKTVSCNNGKSVTYPVFIPGRAVLSSNFYNNQDMTLDVDYSQVRINKTFDMSMETEALSCQTNIDNNLKTLEDILEMLYQKNYNTLSFKLERKGYNLLNLSNENSDIPFTEDDDGNIMLTQQIESLKLPLPQRSLFEKGGLKLNMIIEDIYNRKHKFEVTYDTDIQKDFITYSYINEEDKEFVREKGYQDIESLIIIIENINNKKMILFMVEGKEQELHYFHHIIVQDILTFNATKIVDKTQENVLSKIYFANNLSHKDVIFETPYVKKSQSFKPTIIEGGNNWTNLYRVDENQNSYAYIRNISGNYISADNIYLYYDNINLPETSIIDRFRLKINGTNSLGNKIYINKALNTNYKIKDMKGYELQLAPENITCYSNTKESSIFYQMKLNIAKEKEQESFVEQYSKLLEDNYIFDEDIGVSTKQYLENPNDFITIDNRFWYELSEFNAPSISLNEIAAIQLVIEGYNTQEETELFAETLSETEHSSKVKKRIPSGYFREKINLLYPNQFLLEILRVRFRFNKLSHDIKIFDTKIELKFKNKEESLIQYEAVDDINLNEKNSVTILENYFTPADINNGTVLEMIFDDLRPGEYYHINSIELEAIYTETDINMMINNHKYQDSYYGMDKSSIIGVAEDAYLSGIVYDDVPTMMQLDDNIGIDNKGIKLQDTLYQCFTARDDNITAIELFPYGFRGNPDDTLKIGLYTNSYNTPGHLIKEVLVSSWTKSNPELRGLGKIKYNLNVNGLEINEKYWFKIQILTPQDNSYYLLKGINNTRPEFKLLADENNNYINTFSNLKFNIYSKNLYQTFNSIPVLQDSFDNPYIIIGLHKEKGTIKQLRTNKYVKSISGNDYMSEVFETQPTMVFEIIETSNDKKYKLPTNHGEQKQELTNEGE